jgi:hypothetical protein
MADDGADSGSGMIPKDEYSALLRQQRANPEAVEKSATVDMQDFYGNAVTWNITTIRIEGRDTVFLQKNAAEGGKRWVLPPQVTGVMARHRESIWKTNRRRAGRRAAADRAARGERPAFLKGKAAKGAGK